MTKLMVNSDLSLEIGSMIDRYIKVSNIRIIE